MAKAFHISTFKSPVGTLHFRGGVFYGRIEDFDCTAPCPMEAQARQEAQKQLENGGFRARLVALKQHYQRWLDFYTGEPVTGTVARFDPQPVKARINRIDALISRLDAAGH